MNVYMYRYMSMYARTHTHTRTHSVYDYIYLRLQTTTLHHRSQLKHGEGQFHINPPGNLIFFNLGTLFKTRAENITSETFVFVSVKIFS